MQVGGLEQLGGRASVTRFGLGGAGFGNLFAPLEAAAVIETVSAAYDAGVRYFDTAPLYGFGLSEERLGLALTKIPRDENVISTKVGYSLVPAAPGDDDTGPFVDVPPLRPVFDYSRDAILRSLDESMARLKTDRIDVVLIHDPDEGATLNDQKADPFSKSHFREVMEETYPVLDDLRSSGNVTALGLGMNQWQMLADFARAGDFDCFLLAGRYTLLEQQPLDEFLPLCLEKGISIVVGGPYNSGILALGAVEGAMYNYQPATPEVLDRTAKIEAVCARHEVSLPAAALQFPFGHPAVASIIPGAVSMNELKANLGYFQEKIPADLWEELKRLELIHPGAPVPTGE